jgi:N-acetyl-alpha-D-muramate 1-phosphate uridylyltransferase
MKAMILAAGRGERMRPLTDHTPKPLLQVGGKSLIVWQIERLVQAGITEMVINHAHLGTQIEAALGDGSRFGASICYSRENEALETAGGVANALPLLGSAPFLVVSADIYVECDYRLLTSQATALNDGTLAYLWMVDNPEWHARGDFALVGNRLQLEGEPRLTYSNLGLFHPDFFAGIAPGTKFPMLPLFQNAISAERAKGARFSGLWDNIGTPSQLHALDRALLNQQPAKG